MARFGLVGGSYTSESISADCQRCVNWYVEANESGSGKSAATLYRTPGKKLFATLSGSSVPQMATINGRWFAVSGSTFYEIFADGTKNSRGTITGDTGPVWIATSNSQVMVSSAGHLYCFTLATNAFVEIDTTTNKALQGRVTVVDFSDGYFVALLKNSNKFQISALFDGTSWDPADIAAVSEFPDNIVSMIVDHRLPWMLGQKASVVYQDDGNPLFPFDPIQGAFIEQGCIAIASPVKQDNTIFWIGGDSRGGGVVWRANGFTPQRVSNHAIENEWRTYPTISDAVGYAYQENGHAFVVWYFPLANKTWVYDVATGLWHERSHILQGADLGRCHVYFNGKHYLGDAFSGNIYESSINLLDDNGAAIERRRRAPHVSSEMQWMFHQQVQVDMETGISPQPPLRDGQGNPRGPQAMLRWSDDGGHTWSNEHWVDCGQAGQYKTRAIWRRLGRTRDRVYELFVSDPVAWAIVDAYLLADPGYQTTERMAAQMRKAN